MTLKKIIIAVFLFICSSLFAQQPSHYFLGKDEFEGVQIYDVIQDNNLNYWFATDQGFYKYNHYTFEKIDCPEMKGLSAFGFVKDAEGTIYCYNLNHQVIKIKNNVCSVFYELKENEQSADIFLSVTDDNDLLILTKTALLFNKYGQYIKTKHLPKLYYGFPFKTKSGSIVSHVSSTDSILVINKQEANIIPLRKKNIEKINSVIKFFRINDITYAVGVNDKQLYSFNETTFILEKINQKLFNQTKEILRFYNENNQLWVANVLSGIRYINDIKSNQISGTFFSNYLISDVFKDAEGNLLLSTFNYGIIVIPNTNIADVINLPNIQPVISIQNDKDFGLLLGHTNGQLASLYINDYKLLSNDGSKPLQVIYSHPNFPYIIFDDGKIKAYQKYDKKSIVLGETSLKDVVFDGNNHAYLATNLGVLDVVFQNNNTVKKEFITALKTRTNSIDKEESTGNIYVASSNGLQVLDVNNNIKQINYNNETVFANDIYCNDNFVYVSTKHKEILKIKNGKVVLSIIPKVNNQLLEITKLQVHDHYIHTLSSKGYIVFDFEGTPIFQLNKAHGFSTNKIFDFALIENDLWLCHSKGLQKFHLKKLQNKIEKPLIQFSKIKVNDSILINFSNSVFSHNNRKIQFEVSSPTLRNKETIKYYYKLVGYEDKWQIANYNDNRILYNALTPGKYSFVVKAENQGVFSNPISYSFMIQSPFYLSWWFITLSILSFLGLVFLIYKWQLSIQQKKSQQINELNASKLTAIQSQMNPHFIFNSLNSIQDLVLKGDIEKSYSYITTFSNLVRRTLNYSNKDFIEFEQEIKLLEIYLSLEKLRFKKDLTYTINCDNVEDIMIPPLLIQPFVENCLVHGLLHKDGEKRIKITFELKDNLICIIEDNGIGREQAKAIKIRQRSDHESFASSAIHKRFDILSNVFEGSFGYHYDDLYENDLPVGTRVTLNIPIKHKF